MVVSDNASQYVILSDDRSEESLQIQLANVGFRDFSVVEDALWVLCSSK